MSDFHFLRPQFLYLFIPFTILLMFFFFKKNQGDAWTKICSRGLLPYIIINRAKRKSLFYILPVLVLTLLIIGVSGPTWEEADLPAFKRQSGLVIVMDLSDSMNAEDIKPSRLKRAIYKINDFLNLRKDGQTALVVFSGHPFVVTPLTDDTATIQAQIPVLEAKIMPSKGHNVHTAIQKALDLLAQAGHVEGSILLLTSDLKKPDMEKTAELISSHQVKLAILGCGTEVTTPVISHSGNFLKDKDGSLVMTTLPVDNLKALSVRTKGVYSLMTIDDSDIQLFNNEFSDGFKSLAQKDSLTTVKKWQDSGYLAVLLAIPFVSLIFRRGLLALIFLFLPLSVHASIWTDYFQTADARAKIFYEQENYTEAKDLFENPEWRACSHYKLNEFNEAASLFNNDQSVKGLYNYGTSKAKSGNYEEALKAYAKVLDIEPDHEDTLYNKKIIEEHKESQKTENQQKQDQEKNKDSQDKSQDKNKQDKDKEAEDNEGSDDKGNQTDSPENQDEPQDQGKDESEKEPEKEMSDEAEKEEEDSNMDSNKSQADECEQMQEPGEDDLQRKIDDKWLQRVKDDPGGLLRRKFLQQYQRQNGVR
jgi:Ca-activated chloride channel family protein